MVWLHCSQRTRCSCTRDRCFNYGLTDSLIECRIDQEWGIVIVERRMLFVGVRVSSSTNQRRGWIFSSPVANGHLLGVGPGLAISTQRT